jgi:hypothetical protein
MCLLGSAQMRRAFLLLLFLLACLPLGLPAVAQGAPAAPATPAAPAAPVAPAAPAAPAAAAAPQDKVVITGDVVVAPGESVGDLVVIHGDVLVRGTVHGNLVAIDGDVTIRGAVGGDVVTIAKRATLGRRAHVGGDIRWVRDRPVISPGAIVAGNIDRIADTSSFGASQIEFALGFWAVVSISLLLGGLLLLAVAPGAADAVVRTARSSGGTAALLGVALLVGYPVLAALLLVTVVGTPLGVGMLLAFVPILAIGYLASTLALGRRFVKSRGRFAAFLIGLLILRLVALIPAVGALVSLAAAVFGLGALFVTARRTTRAA